MNGEQPLFIRYEALLGKSRTSPGAQVFQCLQARPMQAALLPAPPSCETVAAERHSMTASMLALALYCIAVHIADVEKRRLSSAPQTHITYL